MTGEKLLANKKHADLLESYKVREAAAIDYMKSVRPDLKILSGPLLDPYVRISTIPLTFARFLQ